MWNLRIFVACSNNVDISPLDNCPINIKPVRIVKMVSFLPDVITSDHSMDTTINFPVYEVRDSSDGAIVTTGIKTALLRSSHKAAPIKVYGQNYIEML